MNFYATIHPWYDQIFPFAMAQRDFVLSFGSGPELELVDVGCGTGSLLVSLAGSFGRCTGLDPDEEMLAGARAKADSAGVPIRLMPGGMLDLDREFAPGSVDRLICFGNTIPHLESPEQVDHFLRQAASVLRPEGMILLQIIHFRRIFDQELPGLPTLENDQVRFVRNYHYTLPDPGVIRFHTILTIKESGQVIENDIPLLALSLEQLSEALGKAGFSDLQTFGSFTRDPFSADSIPLILTSRVSG
ncbi:MAG: methyltransferase domain-containing protein [Bacteroidales bacterium]|jgi:ubiquinone/menaquinone biosynthesis C-methylase UbiE